MDSGELLILKQDRGNYYTGVIAIIVGLILIILGASWTTENLVAFFFFWGVAVPVMVMGAFLILYTKRYKVTVYDEKIICTGTFGNIIELAWKDIVRITYNKRINQLVLGDGIHKFTVKAAIYKLFYRGNGLFPL
jgi:hypothetical protein